MKKYLALLFALLTGLALTASDLGPAVPVLQEVPVLETTVQTTPAPPVTTVPVTTPAETTAVPAMETTPPVTSAPSVILSSSAEKAGLSDTVQAIFQKYEAVGLSVAVFQGQDILYAESFGYADVEKGIPADTDTAYRIASVSKTVTGILAMQLASEGRLDLDADISDYIGLNMRSPFFPDQKITARQLMTHTSGIVDSVKYEEITDGYVYPTLTELMSYGGMYTQNAPGTRYVYSNLAYGLLCAVIEGVTLERFYTYADRQLFTPLNMDAGFLRTQINVPDRIAQIYENRQLKARVKTWGRVEAAYDSIPIGQMYLLGYGDLFISAQDLAKFGIALAGDGSYQGSALLPAEAAAEMNSLQFQNNKVKRGLGLSIETNLVAGRTMYGHPGQSYGMVSGLYYDPADHTGVAFITNGCRVQKNGYGLYTITDELVKAVYAALFP